MLRLRHILHADAEQKAADSLTDLLTRIPAIYIQEIQNKDELVDLTLHVRSKITGEEYIIACEVKSSGQPRYAENALLRLKAWRDKMPLPVAVVFAAPYISPNVRTMCVEQGAGYIDFVGNCLLNFGPVYIERTVATTPPAEQRELKSIYRPKSARILRVLLSDPERNWKIKDLSEASGVSLGQISNVRNSLKNRNWISSESNGTVLVEPGKLLDEWRENYEIEGDSLQFYTPLHGTSLKNSLDSILNADPDDGPLAIMSSYSAAEWLAPYGRVAKNFFYADEAGLEKLEKFLLLQPVKSGANLQVTIPKDSGVFLSCENPSPGIVCTSVVQTYLDLYVSGERGQEAAEHLREQKLKW